MGELTGVVTDPAGIPVAFAMVTTTSVETGHALAWRHGHGRQLTDSVWRPAIIASNLNPAATKQPKFLLRASQRSREWSRIASSSRRTSAKQYSPLSRLRSRRPAPPINPQEPSLEDLGITPSQTKGNAREQALLDRRSHMLKIHQRLGLITIAPLGATLITSAFAGEGRPAGPAGTRMPLWVRRQWACISPPLTLPSGRPRSLAPRRAGLSACTRF